MNMVVIIKEDGLPYLFTTVLQVTHKRLLDTVKFRKLDIDGLACPLQVLRTFGEILAALDTSRRYSEGTLVRMSILEIGTRLCSRTFNSSLTLFKLSIEAFRLRTSFTFMSSCCLRSETSLKWASRFAAY